MDSLDLLLKDILDQAVFIPRAILLTALFTAFGAILQRQGTGERWQFKNLWKQWRVELFLFYTAFMLMTTLFSREITNPYRSSFEHFGFRNDVKWNNEIIENILLFIPFIFFFLQAFKQKKPWKASLVLSIGATVFIELSQLLFWLGEFHFSDIIHNFAGGMVGCGIWLICEGIKHRGRAAGGVK